jgi:hypothetical protein
MTIAQKLGAAGAVIALTGSGAALAGSGAALAATATGPTVGAQKTWTGATAPLTIAGTGLRKGARIPKADRIVYRDVRLGGRQVVYFTIRAPAGKTIRGVMPAGQDARPLVDFLVTNVRPKGKPVAAGYYPGGTRVTLRAREYPAGGAEITGRIYALAG